ncbi:MAG: TDP-N-acetylfucosamine:lipid II N-acetylfucosaminyltransferase [Bacteroidales bacterium]|nr:TDP-N-acetylfucosamine:lipid II N-acetylfucosaminyltransferase [Bacteroidales bacterium]
MKVHLFAGQSNYSHAWLKLFVRHFDTGGHYFVFGFGATPKQGFVYDEQISKRMYHARKLSDLLFRIIPLLFRARWIYFHSLAYDPSLLFWSMNKRILKRSTWIIWGFDLYAFQKRELSLRTRIYERLRRSVIPCFPEIAAYVEEDAVLARSMYGSTADYIQILYPIPVDKELLGGEIKEGGPLNILMGNSGDPANCHREMIEILSVFAGEDIVITCPLSYGGSSVYIQDIISEGERVFGEKFRPLLSILDPGSYAGVLKNTDIALMNHRRQQGLGNILSLLYLGKKVYLRKDTSSYAFFMRNGCKVYDIEDIRGVGFEGFRKLPADTVDTRKYADEIMSEENYIKLWSNLLNRHPH